MASSWWSQCPPFEFSSKYYHVAGDGGGCVRQTSFFGGKPVLNQGVGYSVILGFGAFFAVFTSFLVWLEKRYVGSKHTSEWFNTAGRNVKTGLIASVIVSQWTWAATILQSSNVAWEYGVSGPFWYASGATIQVLLFGIIAIEIKRKAPHAHTVCEIVKARWGTAAHIVFLSFCFLTNIIVTAMLLLGGSAVVNALTGVNIYAASFLIPLGVIVYTLAGGLKATFLASYIHSVIVHVVLVIFVYLVYIASSELGSPSIVYNRLVELASKSRICKEPVSHHGQSCGPASGNYKGSYLTMLSSGGLVFGIINIVGNFGTVFVDNGYWVSAIAARPSSTHKGGIVLQLPQFHPGRLKSESKVPLSRSRREKLESAQKIRMSALLKKPKTENVEVIDDDDDEQAAAAAATNKMTEENGDPDSRQEQEEALVALIEHRTREVHHLRQRVSYYKSQLEEAAKRLNDSETKLARLRRQDKVGSTKSSPGSGTKSAKVEPRSTSPIHLSQGSTRNQPHSKTELLIPAVIPKVSQPTKLAGSSGKAPVSSSAHTSPSVSSQSISATKEKGDKSYRTSSKQEVELQDRGTKRKFEQKEHKELIPLVRTSSSPSIIRCYASNHISSQHKRKLRSLSLCPVNDQLFVTSALDGIVNLWQVQANGSGASLLSSTDCASPKQRRWPEDIAWHPEGNSLFSVYSADSGDSQVSVLNLNRTQGKARVTFLEDKPHVKGIINSIVFPPWENTCFVTGGSDHAVVIWKETDAENVWKPRALHRNMHSSAVMGVAGMCQKQIILSAGADKRIVGFDANVGRAEFKHQIESKCMSVLPNPCDFNLFMVQAGTHEKQLRLFDIRLRQTEIHAFGWKQESSESQSALINQAWSPDGLYISSGTADPMIHIFDIRYHAHKPSQSIRAHQKRVFKAVWLHSCPLLISISSDLNIGLHKTT